MIDAGDWTIAGLEGQGQHPHDWLKNPAQARTWLFKPARPERDRGTREDIAEKLGSELASLLGMPAARVALATRGGTFGALVEDVRLPNWELYVGQTLMPEVVADYDPGDREHCGHTPEMIQRALERFAAPPGADVPETFHAFDVFAGYLVFDALLAHGDRHDRNWAVLIPPPGAAERESLCASFDHAASLGFTLSDADRKKHLLDRTVEQWAERGKASRFEHKRGTRRLTLVQLAQSALQRCPTATRHHWRERLLSVERDSVEALVARAPGLSEPSYSFTVELVIINRRRLLRALD